MRRKNLSRAGKKVDDISSKVLSADFQVTPSMRRKVGDLALWLAAGDERKVPNATRAVIDLLCAAAREPASRLTLLDRSRSTSRGDTGWW